MRELQPHQRKQGLSQSVSGVDCPCFRGRTKNCSRKTEPLWMPGSVDLLGIVVVVFLQYSECAHHEPRGRVEMTRLLCKCFFSAAFVAVPVLMIAASCQSMTLVSPTPDQVVRENVKIAIPVSVLPSGFLSGGDLQRPFIGISVGQPGQEAFVEAVSAASMIQKGDNVIVYWDSKAPYREPNDQNTDKYFKDGSYSLKVEIYEQTTLRSKVVDSGSVNIVLKNKLDRSNAAPAVALVNALSFGQASTYKIQGGLQLFDVAFLPILSSLGFRSDFSVTQTVEDVRPNGRIMLRYLLDKYASTEILGTRTTLYEGQKLLPQLYRLVDRSGKVYNPNMFKRQAEYSITDVLPVLPDRAVTEGDSWPDEISLKIEGVTGILKFTGSCMLDSFEWHQNKECAKLVSQMAGAGQISFNGSKIRSSGQIKAKVTTYFAYKTGKTITRVIDLKFPVAIEQGADQPGGASVGPPTATSATPTSPDMFSANPTAPPGGLPRGGPPSGPYGPIGPGGAVTGTPAPANPTSRGTAIMTVTMQLEQ